MKRFLALLTVALLTLGAFCVFSSCGKNDEKVVTVGYTVYKPMNYPDENGKLIGFDTELAEKVFGNLGYKVVFKEINWNNRYTDLSSGNVDCLWNGFTANTSDEDGVARSEKVDFSYNYMENRQVVVIKEGTTVSSAADLSGKRGSAESGSAGETYGKGFEGATIKGVGKQTDALLEVNTGAVDFAVVDAQLVGLLGQRAAAGIGDRQSILDVQHAAGDF